MIRLFLTLCKCFQLTKKNNDYLLYQLYSDNAALDTLPCAHPGCSSTGSYTKAGSYSRSLICYANGKVERHTICAERVECSSCGHTHALLPSVIIPYSPFSFRFVLSLLYDFVTHKYDTVESLCSHYDISISTLYRIRRRFLDDKKLMLGIMNDSVTSAESFLADFLHGTTADADRRSQAYFKAAGTSFLQTQRRISLSQPHMISMPEAPT